MCSLLTSILPTIQGLEYIDTDIITITDNNSHQVNFTTNTTINLSQLIYTTPPTTPCFAQFNTTRFLPYFAADGILNMQYIHSNPTSASSDVLLFDFYINQTTSDSLSLLLNNLSSSTDYYLNIDEVYDSTITTNTTGFLNLTQTVGDTWEHWTIYKNNTSTVSYHTETFGGSVTVDRPPAVITYHTQTFGGSVTVSDGSPTTTYHTETFGGSVQVLGYSWTNWSSYWVMTREGYGQSPTINPSTISNNSNNNNLNLIWSALILDPEGNTFNWSLTCSNGQSNSDTDDTNGTYSLSLTNLQYSTLYTIWANATDSQGNTTHNTFYFTTKSNAELLITSPSPANNTGSQNLNLTWSISIQDPDSERFNWSLTCSNGQSNSDTDDTNGRKSLTLTNLDYYTTYTIYLNATDGTYTVSYTHLTLPTN